MSEKCQCALSYSAFDDALRSVRRIVEERGLPSYAWVTLLKHELEKTKTDCGVALDKVEGDIRSADEQHLQGNSKEFLWAIETARIQLALDFLDCSRKK